VLRYDSAAPDDGLPPGEGAFPACSLWLDDCLALIGRLTGNFPQAFSHVALVGTALNLREQPDAAPAEQRGATST
jgi:GH15 family glucan-1,4-alpha-glucosidase